MDTLKNFFIGIVVIILSLIILGFVALTWPILLGISSVILSILAFVLFVTLIFYVIVLVGHVTRKLFQK
ncbi:MAG: hypothetical protein ABH862_05170 [Candidatus Omnitrophota bacterium]